MREYNKAIDAIQEVCSFLYLALLHRSPRYFQASEHDDENKHTAEIQQQMLKCNQAIMTQRAGETDQETLERAMRDPEVAVSIVFIYDPQDQTEYLDSQEIMSDPVMQQILQQGQQNPGALQDHMKNPTIRNKIMKLVNAGIIKTRQWRIT